jgi:hypothetical protein
MQNFVRLVSLCFPLLPLMCRATACATTAASCSYHQNPCHWPSERPSHTRTVQAPFLARGAGDRPALPGGQDRPVVLHQQRKRGRLSPQCVDDRRGEYPAGSVAFGKGQADDLPTDSARATSALGPYAATSITPPITQGDEIACCQRKHRMFYPRR